MTELKLKFRREDGTTKKFNRGKSFTLPNWTVKKHKAALEELSKLPKKLSEADKDVEFQFLCIYYGLREVDPKLELEDVRNIHPAMLGDLFNAVYSEGKYDIYFRGKGKKTKSE